MSARRSQRDGAAAKAVATMPATIHAIAMLTPASTRDVWPIINGMPADSTHGGMRDRPGRCRRSLAALRYQRVRLGRGRAAGAVGARDAFEQVPARIVEVDAPPAVPVVDPARFAPERIRPVREPARADPAEDLVELLLAHQER